MHCVRSRIKPFRRAIVAGTFDHLHVGHKKLLRLASLIAGEILACILNGPMLLEKDHRNELQGFQLRKSQLRDFLESLDVDYVISKIEDPIGPAGDDPKADAIVVSPETCSGALDVNRVREENGLKQLVVVVCPFVSAEDGHPVSSTRIRAGEIDEEGKTRADI